MEEALARTVGPEPSAFVRLVFSLHDPSAVELSLRDAGFDEVSVGSATRSLRLPSPAEFLWQYVKSTPLAAHLGQLDGPRRAALQREIVSGWRPFERDGAIVCELPVLTATGRA
jgi:hypothetical protein